MSSWLRNSALAAILLASSLAWADEAIVVKGLRNPVDKSYRKMLRGMDLFDKMHAMAPEASLRYKLLPRKPGAKIEGIALQIVADSFELPVAVAADHTFTLARDPKALEEDASVRSDRKAHSMTWRAEVRTPGLAPNVRRLGDLRLECQVGMEAGLVSHYPSSIIGRLVDVILDTPDFCNQRYAPYLFFSERPLFSVALRAGERREVLSAAHLYAGIAQGRTPKAELAYCDCEALLDRAYTVPLGDRSWPDDTLVELEFMDTGVLTGETKAAVIATYGEAKIIRFESAYEVWVYQWGPQERPLAQTEFVLLFAPSGVVAKSRLRPELPRS